MASLPMSYSAVRKEVTATEIKSGRIALPAAIRKRFFVKGAHNVKRDVILVDENGHKYPIVFKVRANKSIKQEIMGKDGKLLVKKRRISAGDSLVFLFSDSDKLPDGHIRFKLERKEIHSNQLSFQISPSYSPTEEANNDLLGLSLSVHHELGSDKGLVKMVSLSNSLLDVDAQVNYLSLKPNITPEMFKNNGRLGLEFASVVDINLNIGSVEDETDEPVLPRLVFVTEDSNSNVVKKENTDIDLELRLGIGSSYSDQDHFKECYKAAGLSSTVEANKTYG